MNDLDIILTPTDELADLVHTQTYRTLLRVFQLRHRDLVSLVHRELQSPHHTGKVAWCMRRSVVCRHLLVLWGRMMLRLFVALGHGEEVSS